MGCVVVAELEGDLFLTLPVEHLSMHAISSSEEAGGRHLFLQLCDSGKDDYDTTAEIRLSSVVDVDGEFEKLTAAVEVTPGGDEGEGEGGGGGGGGMDVNMMNLMAAVQGGERGFIGANGEGDGEGSGGQFEDPEEEEEGDNL